MDKFVAVPRQKLPKTIVLIYLFFLSEDEEEIEVRSVVDFLNPTNPCDGHLTFWHTHTRSSEGIDQLHSMKTSKRRKKAYPNLQKGLLKNNGNLLHIETTGNCCWRFYKKKGYRGESEDVCPGFEGLPRFMPNSVKQIEKCENADC